MTAFRRTSSFTLPDFAGLGLDGLDQGDSADGSRPAVPPRRPTAAIAAMAPPRLLCVADRPAVIEQLQLLLAEELDVTMAFGVDEALALMASEGPYTVVLSALSLTRGAGDALLIRARELSADTIYVGLTTAAEITAAGGAVAAGRLFRFHCAPWAAEPIRQTIREAVALHHATVVERDLLTRTVLGCVRVLVEVLALSAPAVFARTAAIRSYVNCMTAVLAPPDPWEFEAAAALSQIGCVAVSDEVVERVLNGVPLSDADREAFAAHPATGAELINQVPRLGRVAAIVRRQLSVGPRESLDDRIVLGAAMLRLAHDVDVLRRAGVTLRDALDRLVHRHAAVLLDALRRHDGSEAPDVVRRVRVRELAGNMRLEEDLLAVSGTLVVPRGTDVTLALIERLRRFSQGTNLVEPVRVSIRS